MNKTTSNFLLGQALSLLLSLSIVNRGTIFQNIQTQILLEFVFDICLFAFSLIAMRKYGPKSYSKKGWMAMFLVLTAACAALAGDFFFFISLNFMSSYMCTFFDELNYPISLVVEYLVYRRRSSNFKNVASYIVLLLLTVSLCVIRNEEEHYIHLFGVLTGISFNCLYILAAFLQEKLTPALSVFGFTKTCSIFRFAIAFILLTANMVTGDMDFEKICEFYKGNTTSILLSSSLYAAFYILATIHIEKHGIPSLFANLISSSIYILLIEKQLMSEFDVVIFVATPICLCLIYFLLRSVNRTLASQQLNS